MPKNVLYNKNLYILKQYNALIEKKLKIKKLNLLDKIVLCTDLINLNSFVKSSFRI